MGARAVLYYGDPTKPVGSAWEHHVRASLDVPRFYVEGDAAALVGRELTLAARVDMVKQEAANIIGVLRRSTSTEHSVTAKTSRDQLASSEAILLTAHYDAYSYVPDQAPGAGQAAGAVTLLNVARTLRDARESLRRDIVIAFTTGHGQGSAGIREILHALGPRSEQATTAAEHVAKRKSLVEAITLHDQLASAITVGYWGDPTQSQSIDAQPDDATFWLSKPHAAQMKSLLQHIVERLLDDDLVDAYDAAELAKLAWVQAGLPATTADGAPGHPLLDRYADQRRTQRQLSELGHMPLPAMKRQRSDMLRLLHIAERVARDIIERRATLNEQLRHFESRIVVSDLLRQYEHLLVLSMDLTIDGRRIGLASGDQFPLTYARTRPADAEVAGQFLRGAEHLDEVADGLEHQRTPQGGPRFVNLVRDGDITGQPFVTGTNHPMGTYFEASGFLHSGYAAFTFLTLDDDRRLLGSPDDTFARILGNAAAARDSLDAFTLCMRQIAAAAERLARGHGQLLPTTVTEDLHHIRGRVVSQLGDSIVPDHLMDGALVRFDASPSVPTNRLPPGVGRSLWGIADRDGQFEMPAIWGWALGNRWSRPAYVDVAKIDPPSGNITWSLLESVSGPNDPYRVQNVPLSQLEDRRLTAVVFRSSPVAVFAMPDPHGLRDYAAIDFLDTQTLATPRSFKLERITDATVCHLPPTRPVFVTFKKGTAASPGTLEARAFALNARGPADSSAIPVSAGELFGRGYLPAENPSIVNIELDAARSMAQVNSRRVRLQEERGLADAMLLDYVDRAVSLADEASRLADAGALVDARQQAWRSLAYSAHAHPVARRNIRDAIVSIIFYLFLALPFVFFAERLLIASADIRWQIFW